MGVYRQVCMMIEMMMVINHDNTVMIVMTMMKIPMMMMMMMYIFCNPGALMMIYHGHLQYAPVSGLDRAHLLEALLELLQQIMMMMMMSYYHHYYYTRRGWQRYSQA